MIDEILCGLFGEALFGRLGKSRRAQLLARLFFGLLGAGLGIAGAIHVARGGVAGAGEAMRVAMGSLFGFFAAFFLFNVALGRKWRWPGVMFAVSLVALFVTRMAFGP